MQTPISLFRSLITISILLAAGATSVAAQTSSEPQAGKSTVDATSLENERAFIAENDAAMAKMMAAMAVKPTGDVDADFAAMMIPHHQGAIDMALALLRYGKNERLRRIAQEIIVTQQQEIAAMRLALGQPLPPSAAAPTDGQSLPSATTPAERTDLHKNMNMKEHKIP